MKKAEDAAVRRDQLQKLFLLFHGQAAWQSLLHPSAAQCRGAHGTQRCPRRETMANASNRTARTYRSIVARMWIASEPQGCHGGSACPPRPCAPEAPAKPFAKVAEKHFHAMPSTCCLANVEEHYRACCDMCTITFVFGTSDVLYDIVPGVGLAYILDISLWHSVWQMFWHTEWKISRHFWGAFCHTCVRAICLAYVFHFMWRYVWFLFSLWHFWHSKRLVYLAHVLAYFLLYF